MRNPLSILAVSILMTVFSGQSYGSLYGDPLGADKEFGTQDALDRVFEEYMQRKTPPTTRVDPVNTNKGGEEEVVVPTTRQQGGNQQLVEFFPNKEKRGGRNGILRIRICQAPVFRSS